jgi:hypothetical protein
VSVESKDLVRRFSRARGAERFVLELLADYASPHHLAWPSNEKLMARTRYSERTIQRALKGLRAAGEILDRPFPAGGRRFLLTPGAPHQQVLIADEWSPHVAEKPTRHPRRNLRTQVATEVSPGGATHARAGSKARKEERLTSAKADVVEPRLDAQVSELFAYWQQRCGHAHAKLTPKRGRAVRARLKERRTVAEIRTAIDGAARAAYVDEHGVKHDDLELICRSPEKLDLNIARAHSVPAKDRGRRESPSELLRAIGATL